MTQFSLDTLALTVHGFQQEMAPKQEQSMVAFGVSAILGKKCTFALG